MMKLNLLFSSNTILEGTSSLHQSIWFCTSAVLQVASPLLRVASRLSTVESVSCITILEGKIHLSPFWSFYVLYPVLLGPAPQDWDTSLIGKPDISLSQGGFNSSAGPANIGAERQPFKEKKMKKQSYIWLLVPVVELLVHPSLQLCSLWSGGMPAGQVSVSAIVHIVKTLV